MILGIPVDHQGLHRFRVPGYAQHLVLMAFKVAVKSGLHLLRNDRRRREIHRFRQMDLGSVPLQKNPGAVRLYRKLDGAVDGREHLVVVQHIHQHLARRDAEAREAGPSARFRAVYSAWPPASRRYTSCSFFTTIWR